MREPPKSMRFYLTFGTNYPALIAQLRKPNNSLEDLTAATVEFELLTLTDKVVFQAEAEVVSIPDSKVRFDGFNDAPLERDVTYAARFYVTWPNGDRGAYPNSDPLIWIYVRA